MTTSAKELHPQKANSPIFVTLFGMTTSAKDLHHLKAPFPIFVTLFGITRLPKELQPSYLLLVDYQYSTL